MQSNSANTSLCLSQDSDCSNALECYAVRHVFTPSTPLRNTACLPSNNIISNSAVHVVQVDAKLVKQLRESSGAGMMDCKKALANNDNNLEKATEFLSKKGLASADKKAGRVASEGAIGSYVHAGSM